MAIRIVRYESGHEAEAAEFNRRLRAAGNCPFPVAEQAPEETPAAARAAQIDFQHYLAVEDGGAVRGGYFLRTQPFWTGGQVRIAGHYTAPLSEGIIDKRYAGVGAMMLSHALKQQPLLFAMGMGGMDHPLPRMLRGMGWSVFHVPFFFRVLNGSNFFRHLGPLRGSRLKAAAADVLALSGIGWAGMSIVHRLKTRASMGEWKIAGRDAFEDWADELWRETHEPYSFCAVRDATALRYLYPAAEGLQHIRVALGGKTRGWSALMECHPKNSSYFGGMRVMALVDGLAQREAMAPSILASLERAKEAGADLIFSNQMHVEWGGALRNCGFLNGPSNYLLALSKPLAKLMEPLAETAPRIHFNRGDGDGRVNL